jgi:fucose 4-O-acetylase-like acetyltransferase
MPLFFFLSGYLEKDKTLKENIKQGIRGLIVPYIILYILSFVLWVPSILLWHRDVFENSTHVKELLVKPILGMILGGVYSTDYSTMINAPLWFIVGLFSAKMIHGLLIKIAGKNIRRYIFLNIPVIALVYILKLFSIDLLFSINSALLTFPFFSLGYFLHTVKPDLFLNMKNNFKCSFQIIHYRNILFIGNDSL